MLRLLQDCLSHSVNTVLVMYQAPFSEAWDRHLRRILAEGEITEINQHAVTFLYGGDVLEIWIANRWYFYAHLFRLNGECVERKLQARPRFKTMRLLHGMVQKLTPKPVTRADFYELGGGNK
jgi:hypothetical protein